MTQGKETFGLNKTEFGQKLGKIIGNFRANSRLVGPSKEFVIRACKLTERWAKMANDPEVTVYLRNLEVAGGRKVKMLSLERGNTRQPVSKAKLVGELYPVKKVATTASTEERHYNAVKAAMRGGISSQLKDYRNSIQLPIICTLSGLNIRQGMKTDVDHVEMCFSEIADSFLIEKGLCYTDISLIGPPTAKKFREQELWEEWAEFHRKKAKYSLVLARANRSKGSDGYKTPEKLYGSFAKEDPEDLSLDF